MSGSHSLALSTSPMGQPGVIDQKTMAYQDQLFLSRSLPPPLPRLTYSVQDTPTTITVLYSAGIPDVGLTSQYLPLPTLLCMEETGHLNWVQFYEKRDRPWGF